MIVPDSMNLIDNKEHFDIIKSVQVSKENFWFDFETKQRQNSSVERWGSYENYEGYHHARDRRGDSATSGW